jgi:hypothetical protein
MTFGCGEGSFFPHATCFQQLMRGEEAYNLNGANVEESAGVLKLVGVKAKNHRLGYPQHLVFPVDVGRLYCVGFFIKEYMGRCWIVAGNKHHLFACKIVKKRSGLYEAFPEIKVTKRTMWDDGKRMIKAIGLDPSRFASHSAKRGGALAAAQAGLNDVELTRVGNWKSPNMAALYLRGSEEFRTQLIDSFRT